MSQSVADRLDANTGREWSDAELRELGNMLVFGLSIEAIARLLGRYKAEVRGDRVPRQARQDGLEIRDFRGGLRRAIP